jgi:O-antigen ligase
LRAQIGGLAIFVLSGAAFLLAGHHLRHERWLERIVWLFLALGGAYIFLYHLVGGALPEVGHALDTFFTRGTAGSLFWVWLISLAFAQAVFNPHLRASLRAMLWILIGGAFYVRLVLSVDWISGWLPPLVALVTILLASGRYLAVVGTCAAGMLGYLNAPRIATIVMAGDNPYSLETRLEAWRILLGIFKVSPWLGIGPANYYWYTPLYPILGYYVRFNSHNNYIDLLAQTGVIGLACFLWFMWEVGRLAWRLSLAHPPGFQQAYALACLGGLAGMLVAGFLGDWVVPFVYNVGLDGFRSSMLGWLFLGGLVAMEALLRRREPASGVSLS